MTTDAHRPQQQNPWAPPGTQGWVGGGPQQAATATLPASHDRRRGRGRTLSAAVLAAVLGAGATATGFAVLDEDATGPAAAAADATSGFTQDGSTQDGSTLAPLDTEDVSWSEVAEAVAPSVVSIGVRSQTGSGEGSGVIIDGGEGLVLTNNHVVAGGGAGAQVQVALNDGRVLEAEVVGTDPSTDLAVLRMLDAPSDLQALAFGDSDAVAVGQPVMALGNPLGLAHTVTTGIVSAVDRPVTTQSQGSSPFEGGVPVVTNAIQTDAAVNPGNSGGALVDASGRLIGINSSIATTGATAGTTPGSIGLGFAIPSNQAEWVAGQLVESGTAQHAFLGVSLEEGAVEVDGVRHHAAGIADVVDGTPAAEAGLRRGEYVLAVDGERVVGAEALVAQVREREPGTEVTVSVADDTGSVREVTVVFGVRPNG